MANGAVELDVGPAILDFVVEGLELGDSLVLSVQSSLIHFHLLLVELVLRLQFDDLSGPGVSENAVVTDGLRDLVEAPLESTHITNSNVVNGLAASMLVLDGGPPLASPGERREEQ